MIPHPLQDICLPSQIPRAEACLLPQITKEPASLRHLRREVCPSDPTRAQVGGLSLPDPVGPILANEP